MRNATLEFASKHSSAKPAGPMRIAIHSAAPSRKKIYIGLWLTLMSAIVLLAWQDFDTISANTERQPIATAGLTLNSWANKLELKWNPDSAPLRNAKSVDMLIRDGARQMRVPLTAAALRNGNIVYQPLTADVMFRLETLGARPFSESLRYLAALHPASSARRIRPGRAAQTGTADRQGKRRFTTRATVHHNSVNGGQR